MEHPVCTVICMYFKAGGSRSTTTICQSQEGYLRKKEKFLFLREHFHENDPPALSVCNKLDGKLREAMVIQRYFQSM